MFFFSKQTATAPYVRATGTNNNNTVGRGPGRLPQRKMVAPGPRPLSPPGPRPRTHLDLVVLVAFKVKAAAIKRAALPAAAASIACWPCCDRVIACPSSSARRNTRPAAPTVRPAGCCRTETHTAAACHHTTQFDRSQSGNIHRLRILLDRAAWVGRRAATRRV